MSFGMSDDNLEKAYCPRCWRLVSSASDTLNGPLRYECGIYLWVKTVKTPEGKVWIWCDCRLSAEENGPLMDSYMKDKKCRTEAASQTSKPSVQLRAVQEFETERSIEGVARNLRVGDRPVNASLHQELLARAGKPAV